MTIAESLGIHALQDFLDKVLEVGLLYGDKSEMPENTKDAVMKIVEMYIDELLEDDRA